VVYVIKLNKLCCCWISLSKKAPNPHLQISKTLMMMTTMKLPLQLLHQDRNTHRAWVTSHKMASKDHSHLLDLSRNIPYCTGLCRARISKESSKLSRVYVFGRRLVYLTGLYSVCGWPHPCSKHVSRWGCCLQGYRQTEKEGQDDRWGNHGQTQWVINNLYDKNKAV